MPRPSLLPAAVLVLAGFTVGLTGCGDDSGDITAEKTNTTVAETTTSTPADGSADDTETTTADDSNDTGGESPFADIDLGEKLNPIDGFTYETLPDAARQAMLASFEASPEVVDLVAAVGSTTVVSEDGTSLLIFLGLNRTLSDAEQEELVTGVTSGGTGLEQGEVAGQTGWAYVNDDGSQGFVTVRGDTVVIGQSDSSDHLAAVVSGLFTANPEL